jgi:hypothetical protein
MAAPEMAVAHQEQLADLAMVAPAQVERTMLPVAAAVAAITAAAAAAVHHPEVV